jgi:serine protease Do
MARTITDTLVKTGKVRRGQLGITVVKLNTDPAKELGIKETKGVGVAQVQPGSGADQAGLKKGDVITGLNGTEVIDPNVFRNLVASTAPGSAVTLTVVRDGRQLQLRATLGELIAQPADRDTAQPR